MSEAVRVLVVLHGDRVNVEDLSRWASDAHYIVAADGGAEHLLNAGISPDVVTGDFDGLVESVRANLPSEILELNGDQNTTDCQKALALAQERFGATDIAVWGADGSRIDHVISTLGFAFSSPTKTRVTFGSSVAHFSKPGASLEFEAPVNTLVSLMPLAKTVVSRTSGLEWDASGLKLSSGERDGISNRVMGSPVTVEVESGGLAVFVGRFEGDTSW